MAGAEAQTRSSSAGLRLLGLLAALTPTPALAGAWVAPKGGQEILTTSVGQRSELLFYEGAYYREDPFAERNALVTGWWTESNYDSEDGWRAEATVGVKRALYRGERSVVAVQAGALWISHPNGECDEGGAEVRALGGRSFGASGFANVEVAARALNGGCEGGRVDLTAGYRPRENWLALGQVFLDSPLEGDDSIRAQLTVVRFGRSGRGVQVGVRARLDGEEAEPTLVIGLWGRPGD